MNFWNFNLFCYLCQFVFDPKCKDLFKSQNISLGFKVSNMTHFDKIDNCYFQDFDVIYENDSSIFLVEYNYLNDNKKFVDFMENEISVDKILSFFINYNHFHLPKQKFDLFETKKQDNIKLKDYDFIHFNKKSLYKLLPNIFETTRNISTIYFDLYVNDTVGFFTFEGKPKLSYYWLTD